jgi:uridine phosphorylase
MQPEIAPGDVIVATGAIRQDGTSREYLPIEFPAVADFKVTSALYTAAQNLGYPNHVGVVQAKDSFYGQHSPESMPTSSELLAKWEAWKRGGCLASEMEGATLFIVSAARKLRSGAVFHCVWNQEAAKTAMPKDRKEDTSCAIKTAIEAIRILIKEDKKDK